jgi:hypothetical protein
MDSIKSNLFTEIPLNKWFLTRAFIESNLFTEIPCNKWFLIELFIELLSCK